MDAERRLKPEEVQLIRAFRTLDGETKDRLRLFAFYLASAGLADHGENVVNILKAVAY